MSSSVSGVVSTAATPLPLVTAGSHTPGASLPGASVGSAVTSTPAVEGAEASFAAVPRSSPPADFTPTPAADVMSPTSFAAMAAAPASAAPSTLSGVSAGGSAASGSMAAQRDCAADGSAIVTPFSPLPFRFPLESAAAAAAPRPAPSELESIDSASAGAAADDEAAALAGAGIGGTAAALAALKGTPQRLVRSRLDGQPFYSLIADGVHVHPYAVTMAASTHPDGLILVTDAMQAMGLPPGRHSLAGLQVDIFHGEDDGHYGGPHAVLAGTTTLAGAVVPLDECLRNLVAFTRCPVPAALAAVTTHPAALLGLSSELGSLRTGAWADLVILDHGLNVQHTLLAGQLAWSRSVL